MAGKRISPVDHAWLRMDDPRNWMIITGLMTFDAPVSLDRLKAAVQRILPRYRRFRQRLVWPPLHVRRPTWEDDPDFDLDCHIETVRLAPPGGQTALQDLISELMSRSLDCSRPLWQYYLVEDYGPGSALVARLHHCLADGIALVRMLLSMTDTTPEASLSSQPALDPEPPAADPPPDSLDLIPPTLKDTARAARRLARTGLRALEDPAYAIDLAGLGASTAAAVSRLVLRWPDPETPFKGPLGVEKRAAWSEPLDLDDVKRIGRAYGATVNDVLLAAVAGALRRYLQQREEPVDGLSIRGIVPVNLRPLDDASELGNKFGLIFCSLPIGVGDPIQRLRLVMRSMNGLKATPEAAATYGILAALGMVHPWLQEVAVGIFDTKGTAVMTNVPGPRQPLYLAGAPIRSVMAWVPQSGRVSLGISLISYNGSVWLGLATDKNLVPDPERIIAGFGAEFEEIKRLAEAVLSKRRAPVLPLLSMLDQAMGVLDEALAAQPPAGPPEPEKRACQSLARSGLPCKNPPLPGQAFCRVHQKQQ